MQQARRPRYLTLLAVVLFFCASVAAAQQTAAIASAHPLATAAGEATLKRGGNAFDAAVAVAAALAVVEPYSSGLGGGGFWLLHRSNDRFETMVDGRETAPADAHLELYIDAAGKSVRGATTTGGTAAAIPGTPAAMVHVSRRYGRLPLAVTLAPAIDLARSGFRVDRRYARIAQLREGFLREGRGTAAIFLDGDVAPQPGFLLRQPELAATLEVLAREGERGFYSGRIARALVESVNAAGGVWRIEDLNRYRVVERVPVSFEFRGARITSAALPSAGGVALAQSLGILGRFPVGAIESPETAHLVVEALRRVFQDRATYLGDADFVDVPLARLLDPGYLKSRSAEITMARATQSDAPGTEDLQRKESGNTTHLSVIDSEGNRVAATLTINLLFGSGVVATGTGVLLNNEMDDFSLREGVANAFRLRGGSANGVAPGKRPLSSMTPTFVEDAKGVLILGAPGGSRIVSQVLLAVLAYTGSPRVDLANIVGMPRYHHQFWPDRVEIEPVGFSDEWRRALRDKGHEVRSAGRQWGNMQVVFSSRETGLAHAASDPRGTDVAWY
jgi:gamma-glutamyltranspeptidase/glutathione hydrolase